MNDSVTSLLDYLKRTRGFDFSGYKRPTLERRIAKRLEVLGIDDHDAYVDYLEVHPDEFELLFDTLLINVTGFFRDPQAWAHLAENVIPEMIDGKPADEALRIWSAACATGEEAYSIAILLHRALGDEAYRERVKIYGTDLDENALISARQATYSDKRLEGVPEDVRRDYFESSGDLHMFRPDLRRTVIFGRNDLIQDAPISRVDMLICRNALIYFTAETQNRILDRLHFALRERGVLFVGKSELLIRHSDRFDPIDLSQRIFRKRARATSMERYAFVAPGGPEPQVLTDRSLSIRETVVDAAPVAQIATDADGTVVMVNRSARALFGLRERDVGRPLQDLEISYRPAELRAPIERATEERRPIHVGRVEYDPSAGESKALEIEIVPVVEGESVLGASITFADVTSRQRMQDELDYARRELENVQEELQSTVEELETTNEELQSTNEELETTNEELHSVNEELGTTNEELRARGKEVDEVNAFLETILTSMGVAVVVLDRQLRVQIWNEQAEDLWGLRSSEVVGEPLLGLDFGLPVERLRSELSLSLTANGGQPPEAVELAATNRRGKPVTVVVRCIPMAASADVSLAGDGPAGVVMLMEATPL